VNLETVRKHWLERAVILLRWSRAAGYALIAAAGAWSLAQPPASVTSASGHHIVTYVWASVMAVSGVSCAVGAAAGRWPGEYAGLWPLAFVAAAFGISAIARGQGSIAGGLFLLGFFWILVSRWQEVALLRIESVRRQQERGELT
jgi:hypothetical protein